MLTSWRSVRVELCKSRRARGIASWPNREPLAPEREDRTVQCRPRLLDVNNRPEGREFGRRLHVDHA
eukprot:346529-Prorocentrum_lima.AAC.1